ncbi:replicative DNA helicase [Paenibacillus sp. FSL R7-0302]|uniref:replicative DNA helicase n=1 Tax=Paenibacillus sp. FSL R7-0302 TaxID=2921681 RepID=UPI0030F89D84
MATKTKAGSNVKSDKYLDIMREEVLIPEAYLTALFWNNPEQYIFYPEEKINTKTLLNTPWAFYFGLGRKMQQAGVKIFDDISIMKHVKELNVMERFEKYGGFDTVREVMEEVEGFEPNLEAYYSEIKKYAMLRNLGGLFGDKVYEKNGKYDYHKIDKEDLYLYWFDKVNQLGLDGDAKFEEHFLLEGLDEDIEEWDATPDIGLPFYNSSRMTKICTGFDYGNLYIYGGFGGSGKTAMSFNKVVMSCIENEEKLLIIANEQGIKEFKKLLLTTALGIKKEYLYRQRLNEGSFTEEEKRKLSNAIEFIKAFSKQGEDKNNSKLVALVFMEDYIMGDVKKIIRHYANRGYKSVMIDTGKPSDGNAAQARWEVFTEDFKELYKLCRPNGGGLNLRMWVNVQLADNALTRRFLNEHAFGESKKIKNEASVVFMGRNVWDDEYEGGDSEIKAWNYRPKTKDDHFAEEDERGYVKEEFTLKRFWTDEKGNTYPNQYYLIFTPKNRRGRDNKGGQPVLIMQSNFNNNSWHEVGWCHIHDDRNY